MEEETKLETPEEKARRKERERFMRQAITQAKKAEKLMDVAKIGAKGQIVIPKSMRDMFGLRPGDTLLLLADGSRGIAMNKLDSITDAVEKAMMGEPTADDKRFAAELKTVVENNITTVEDEKRFADEFRTLSKEKEK